MRGSGLLICVLLAATDLLQANPTPGNRMSIKSCPNENLLDIWRSHGVGQNFMDIQHISWHAHSTLVII